MKLWKLLGTVVLLTGYVSAADIAPVHHEPNALNSKKAQKRHYVVMVSLDGFRWDYAAKWSAPHLLKMAEEGASAPEGMIPSFPSLTFPNHYTIVTGLYPEHHGIVDNEFLDPKRGNARYYYKDPASSHDGSWYGGVPLWSLAERQGLRSASMFWVGSEAEIAGKRPSYWVPFDDNFDDEKRVAQVMQWLALPESERPHLITVYYSNVDHAGHDFGPDSTECRDAVHHVDGLMGELEAKLKATGLPVDLIVVSDHGMVKFDDRHWLAIDSMVDLKGAPNVGERVYPKTEEEKERIYSELKGKNDPRIAVYRLKDVPGKLEFNENGREGDPVIEPLALEPTTIHAKTPLIKGVGGHGFDPAQVPQMKAIFYAEGPDVKQGVKLESFPNVDVYDFVAGILKLKPAKNDGDAKVLKVARR
ncbi:MAG: ectonucleotide pyrophosphatase/phosphodiesterase [Edaphobacter sp.]|uniref:alkaline phosphatase family protein n=1 Tax=Edaphobacter sp. TaxID=1934404 RepID=UPI002390E124|nr:ectonucleotide pyrophosphatase/phosphodiesterase [Edaphobacter sp.]MDE1177683.1 ectonucleotide pyrophosphatase/phosphodiesterase [Edaphobacter sp.]